MSEDRDRESPERRALRLIETLYQTTSKPSAWQAFAEQLSLDMGDQMVAVNLVIPGTVPARVAYRVHSPGVYAEVFARHVLAGTDPWPLKAMPRDRFMWGRDLFPDEDLEATAFYREYMKPQGLKPVGGLGCVFARGEDGLPAAAVGVYAREGCRRLTDVDMATCNLLVAHLKNAWELFLGLTSVRRRREALAEAMDLIPSGVVFIDGRGRVAATNRAAERLADAEDGFSLAGGLPQATRATSARAMRRILDSAVGLGQVPGQAAYQAFTIARHSEARPYAAWVGTLRGPGEARLDDDPVAILFVTDPDQASPGLADHLRALYELSPAEADLARLLCDGHSIEQVAEIRGVSLHTVRAQLKACFGKTGTRRQGEFVAMALGSAAAGVAQPDLARPTPIQAARAARAKR